MVDSLSFGYMQREICSPTSEDHDISQLASLTSFSQGKPALLGTNVTWYSLPVIDLMYVVER